MCTNGWRQRKKNYRILLCCFPESHFSDVRLLDVRCIIRSENVAKENTKFIPNKSIASINIVLLSQWAMIVWLYAWMADILDTNNLSWG